MYEPMGGISLMKNSNLRHRGFLQQSSSQQRVVAVLELLAGCYSDCSKKLPRFVDMGAHNFKFKLIGGMSWKIKPNARSLRY